MFSKDADAALSSIEKVAGARPDTCPWRAYDDPVISDVLRAYKWLEAGELCMWLGEDPPNHIIEGLDHYKTVSNLIEYHEYERQKRERSKKTR